MNAQNSVCSLHGEFFKILMWEFPLICMRQYLGIVLFLSDVLNDVFDGAII